MTLQSHSPCSGFATPKALRTTGRAQFHQSTFPNPQSTSQAAADCLFIQQVIASAHQVKLAKLRAPTRQRAPVAFARQVAMYLAHISRGLTLTEVGRCFDRDRTTVAHACRLVEDNRDTPEVDLALDCLEAAIAERLASTSVSSARQ